MRSCIARPGYGSWAFGTLGLSLCNRLPVADAFCGTWCAGLKAFFTTPQLSVKDKVANSLALGTSPIVRALIDPEGGMRDIRGLDNISFADWFKRHGGSQGSIDRMWDPIGARFCGLLHANARRLAESNRVGWRPLARC